MQVHLGLAAASVSGETPDVNCYRGGAGLWPILGATSSLRAHMPGVGHARSLPARRPRPGAMHGEASDERKECVPESPGSIRTDSF